jgi:hypothetical protein
MIGTGRPTRATCLDPPTLPTNDKAATKLTGLHSQLYQKIAGPRDAPSPVAVGCRIPETQRPSAAGPGPGNQSLWHRAIRLISTGTLPAGPVDSGCLGAWWPEPVPPCELPHHSPLHSFKLLLQVRIARMSFCVPALFGDDEEHNHEGIRSLPASP